MAILPNPGSEVEPDGNTMPVFLIVWEWAEEQAVLWHGYFHYYGGCEVL